MNSKGDANNDMKFARWKSVKKLDFGSVDIIYTAELIDLLSSPFGYFSWWQPNQSPPGHASAKQIEAGKFFT